jgi:glycerophosphoryl diester phosphodiesterase
MSRTVAVYGHRGARGLFPENTINGFAGALAIGVDGLELDVGVTADGVVVVSHDPALNRDLTRGPDGRWLRSRGPLIRDLTRAALESYDVGRIRPGSSYARAFPDQAPADGARIPMLGAVFRLDPGTRLLVEMKTFPTPPDWTVGPETMADAVAAVADREASAHRLVLLSFDWRGLRHLRRTRPEIALAWLTSARTVQAASLWWGADSTGLQAKSVPGAVAAEGGSIWGPEHNELNPDLVAEAHALGIQVVTWTVNRAEDMARLITWGVDGLITDRPDIARQVLLAEGIQPAARDRDFGNRQASGAASGLRAGSGNSRPHTPAT